MKPRFYVMFVQYNKTAEAENRTVPSAYDDGNAAIQKFHDQMAKDMSNSTLGWNIGYILDNFGNVLRHESWIDPEWLAEQEAEEETAE